MKNYKNKKIRVGLFAGHHYPRLGGMEFCNHFQLTALNQLPDVQASIACGTLPEIPKDFPYPYPTYRAKSFWKLTPWLHQLNQKKMIRKEKTNLLHGSMLHGGGLIALDMKKHFGLPMVVQSHGSDVQTVPRINYGACLNNKTKKTIEIVLREADHIIALSSINKTGLTDLGAEEEKISIIHNGIQYAEIQKVEYKNIRVQYNLRHNDFVIITVGRNRPVKRMELLFQALASLGEQAPEIKCLCVGPEENLKELAKKYAISWRIRLTGIVPSSLKQMRKPPSSALVHLYQNADLYISVSYMESFGNAAAEALACGTPIIIGSQHGIKDLVKSNTTGWIMKKETPAELASIFLKLSSRRNELHKRRGEISKSVSHLTWDNTAKQMRDVYYAVLEGKRH